MIGDVRSQSVRRGRRLRQSPRSAASHAASCAVSVPVPIRIAGPAAIRNRSPGATAQPRQRRGNGELVGNRHPDREAGAPSGGNSARGERINESAAPPRIRSRRTSEQPAHCGVFPQLRDRLLEQVAHPAGAERLPALHPRDGHGVSSQHGQPQIRAQRLGHGTDRGPARPGPARPARLYTPAPETGPAWSSSMTRVPGCAATRSPSTLARAESQAAPVGLCARGVSSTAWQPRPRASPSAPGRTPSSSSAIGTMTRSIARSRSSTGGSRGLPRRPRPRPQPRAEQPLDAVQCAADDRQSGRVDAVGPLSLRRQAA